MSYIKIIVHCVWSTKHRDPLLINRDHRILLFEHIRQYAKSKNIIIDQIGGEKDHIHCLISMRHNQSISQIIQFIKGESTFWFNRKGWGRMEWQDDYFAVSVSESILDNVRRYIQNQEDHHKRKLFDQEYEELMSVYGFGR